jgi:hypothetical protein
VVKYVFNWYCSWCCFKEEDEMNDFEKWVLMLDDEFKHIHKNELLDIFLEFMLHWIGIVSWQEKASEK